jgi:hypothetical protein
MNRLVLSTVAAACGVFLAPLWSDSAFAERRVALVMGNSAYQHSPTLPNPARDAQAVAAMFKKAGFDVVSAHLDLGSLQAKRAIRQFEDAATDADIAVVYYAGHGIEIRGINYVIPVDAKLASDRDADDEAITLNRLVESVDGAKRLRLIILDACRDNPFVRTMKRQRTAALRAVSGGLGKVEPTSSDTLIAYAAKAGSTAEDGDTQHSPFTAALLNNLFEPGLDIRLAFGRVRDEVLKNTRSRQEPFVYGSVGGGVISLVPAPAQPALATANVSGQRSDYDLVDKIGTKQAWEVFLTQHPAGFYADLARQQIAKLAAGGPGNAMSTPRSAPEGTLAALDTKPPSPARPSSEEQRAWDKIKDSSNPTALRDFIGRYPSSVLANTAQTRLEALERAAQEREEKTRVEREAKAAEAARLKAEREAKLEEEARAKQEAAAEAARQKAEREEKTRAEREAKAAEAARLKAEREAKLAEEARTKQEAAAEAARQKAERDAALKRAEEERRTKAAEQQKAEREAAVLKRAEEERLAKLEEAARGKAEAACKREEDRFAALKAAGNQGWAREDLKRLAEGLACERLRPSVVAALEKLTTDPDLKVPAGSVEPLQPLAGTTELVRSAQKELARIGCFAGTVDGSLNVATKDAVKRYQTQRRQQATESEITDGFVSELKKQSLRVCPLVCPSGKVAEGETCIAARKPQRQKDEDDEDEKPRRQKAKQEESKPKPAERPQPRVRQEAESRPSRPSGGGGGGGRPMIGVGF